MRPELVWKFCSLFDGSREAVGTDEGGCRRLADPDDWELEVEGHLRFTDCAIGVYPMTTMIDDDETTLGATHGPWHWVVKWGCVDFDEGDEQSFIHAVNVHYVLKELGVASYIERSRSKGYHVWVFCDTWCNPEWMRNALLAVCQIADAPTKEINPKSSELKEGQLGNYVRLPYPGALTGPIWAAEEDGLHRRVVVTTEGEPLSFQAFLEAAQTVPEALLEDVAAYYVRPPQDRLINRQWTNLSGSAVDRLRGKARIIFYNGPLESASSTTGFRGHTLWKLACYMAEDGQHTPDEALDLLRDADVRWGKFSLRTDGELRLKQMIDRAFSRGD